MKAILLALTLLCCHFAYSQQGGQPIAKDVLSEFERLHRLVSNLQPEFEVGGYLKGKAYGDHKLLWKIAKSADETEVIRIYRDKGDKQQAFEVAYHHNGQISPGRMVVRRFVGPAQSGWRADTVDASSGRYLGSQGTDSPYVDERDLEILNLWQVHLPKP